jgi:Trypsin-co-occurring domain 2
MGDEIELSTLIKRLRHEIETTWWEGQTSAIVFEVGSVEVEVNTQLQKDGKAEFGVKFLVVSAGGGGGLSTTDTQRIKLTLTPRDRRDPTQPLRIAGELKKGEGVPKSGGSDGESPE